MKYLIFPLLVLPALLMSLFPAADEPAAPVVSSEAELTIVEKGPVVLELFTSQGCSSCPAADDLLRELDASNDQVIALSFHVDYWNYLGWADPFSSPYYSARQTDYTDVLQERTYTPQLVVNGRQTMIGSRKAEVAEAIKTALSEPLTHNPTFTAARQGGKVTIDYEIAEVPTGSRITALLVQPEATSSIKRGENKGRELHHVNVVRAMQHADALSSGKLMMEVPDGLLADDLQVVLLVQKTYNQAIVGVARAD